MNMDSDEELEKLVSEITDVTEPSSMDKILIYVDELHLKDEEFLEILKQRLEGVEPDWEYPWYRDPNHGSMYRKPTQRQGEEQFRTDKFTKDEHDIMERNWHEFRKKYNVPDQLVSLTRYSSSHRKTYTSCKRFLTAYLGKGTQRCLHSLFFHVATDFALKIKNKCYNENEELIIETCFLHKPKLACSILKNVLGRDPRALQYKFRRTFDGKPEKSRIRWSLPLATKFVKSLMKATNLPLEELKYKKFDKSIWLQVENDMGQYYIYLRQFWNCYLHVQLFVKYDVKINSLRLKIFKHLQASEYKIWSDILWKKVVKEFNVGFTHIFLYRVCNAVVKPHENYLRTPLNELIEYAFVRMKSHRFIRRRLKTLAFNDEGELEFVHYERKFQ